MLKIGRSIVAVVVGLMLISILVASIEFAIVTIVNGGVPPLDDPAAYAAVRNQPSVLFLKLVCNTVGALVGGYVTAWIANESRIHGLALATIQTILLIWGMFFSELGEITPIWMRIALILITFPAIVFGAHLRERRRRLHTSSARES